VLATQVPAEPLFKRMDVADATGHAASDGGQVNVAGSHQSGQHVDQEPPPPRIGKRLGNPGGK
jgi:hypothetical protein